MGWKTFYLFYQADRRGMNDDGQWTHCLDKCF